MAVRATSPQAAPAQHGNVLIPPDRSVASRAVRSRAHHALSTRQSPDAYIQEAGDTRPQGERKTGEYREVVQIHGVVLPLAVPSKIRLVSSFEIWSVAALAVHVCRMLELPARLFRINALKGFSGFKGFKGFKGLRSAASVLIRRLCPA